MAAVSLFWNTNMAAGTSCENALYLYLSHLSQVHETKVSEYHENDEPEIIIARCLFVYLFQVGPESEVKIHRYVWRLCKKKLHSV